MPKGRREIFLRGGKMASSKLFLKNSLWHVSSRGNEILESTGKSQERAGLGVGARQVRVVADQRRQEK